MPGFATVTAAAVAAQGQEITLARGAATATVRAFVRGFRAAELAPGTGLQQGDRMVVIAGDALTGAGWTGGTPRRGDRLTIAGSTGLVQSAERIEHGGAVVRYNLAVRGG